MRINLLLPLFVFASLSATMASTKSETGPPTGVGLDANGASDALIHDHLPHKPWSAPANWNAKWQDGRYQQAGLQPEKSGPHSDQYKALTSLYIHD